MLDMVNLSKKTELDAWRSIYVLSSKHSARVYTGFGKCYAQITQKTLYWYTNECFICGKRKDSECAIIVISKCKQRFKKLYDCMTETKHGGLDHLVQMLTQPDVSWKAAKDQLPVNQARVANWGGIYILHIYSLTSRNDADHMKHTQHSFNTAARQKYQWTFCSKQHMVCE